MSNIAVPNRTEAVSRGEVANAVRTLLATIILLFLLVSFTPFKVEDLTSRDAGNLLNQMGYAGLALIAIVGQALFTDRRVAASLFRPFWLLMVVYLFASVAQSPWPDDAVRAVLFALAAMVAATGALCLPPDTRSFRIALAVAALAVLGLSYAGIALLPAQAIHQGDEHAGLWRGIYSHKNIAGPVMAGLFFAGLYLIRCRQWLVGPLVALLAAIFVYKTGSKTTLGLLPLVAFLVVGARLLGGRWLPVILLGAAMAVMALMTLGAALSPTLDAILQSIRPDTTFTGRLDLWRFAIDVMQPHQWTGFGFESFWATPIVGRQEVPLGLSWDPSGAAHAHNGYLDIAISMGWPALLVIIPVLVLLPFLDYTRCLRERENERLADLFLMILSFALLDAFLESFFFNRGDPVWMLTWISIVGLRLVSKFRMAP